MVFNQPADLAPPLLSFFDRVEAGVAPLPRDATAERIAEGAKPFVLAPIVGVALFSFYALVVIAAAVCPELGCAAGGLMLAAARAPWAGTLIACFVGVLLGELIVRGLLRHSAQRFGVDAADRMPFRWLLRRSAVETSARRFERSHAAGVLWRFLSGQRMPAAIAINSHRRGWRGALAIFALTVLFGALWTLVGVALATGLAWLLLATGFEIQPVAGAVDLRRAAVWGVSPAACCRWRAVRLL